MKYNVCKWKKTSFWIMILWQTQKDDYQIKELMYYNLDTLTIFLPKPTIMSAEKRNLTWYMKYIYLKITL